jgi:hypothetical protein
MAYFDHDLFQALSGCDRLSGEWEQTSCYGGVFMENVISDSAQMPSRFLKTDDPLYPCTAVAEKYREQCYFMQTSHMLTLFDNDFSKVFEDCTRVEGTYRNECFQSIGRDVSGFAGASVSTAKNLCALGLSTEARTDCFIGAATDFLQTNGPDAARSLCSETGDSRALCTEALEEQIQML